MPGNAASDRRYRQLLRWLLLPLTFSARYAVRPRRPSAAIVRTANMGVTCTIIFATESDIPEPVALLNGIDDYSQMKRLRAVLAQVAAAGRGIIVQIEA